MKKMTYGKFPFYTFDKLSACPGLLHFTSSGEQGEYSNLGFIEGSTPSVVLTNRMALAEAVGFSLDQLTVGAQVHSAHIAVITQEEAGRGGKDRESRLPDTDALVTRESGICLMVMSADCVPILLYDPVQKVIAAVHAGWRGTVGGIAGKTVLLMQEAFNCVPADILVGIGPSIGRCCFEVGGEVAGAFRDRNERVEGVVYAGKNEGKYQVDLWEANRRQLLAAGVGEGNIEVAGVCTFCNHDRFFSYRYDHGNTGRMGTGIMLC